MELCFCIFVGTLHLADVCLQPSQVYGEEACLSWPFQSRNLFLKLEQAPSL